MSFDLVLFGGTGDLAWRWVEPILEHWKNDMQGAHLYAASAMIARDGFCRAEEC